MSVVKASLSVSHGQADVERGFSLNKQIVLESRVSLKHKTVRAIRTVKDVIRRYDSVDKIPISTQMLRKFRSAHASYSKDLAVTETCSKEKERKADEKAKAVKEIEDAGKKKEEMNRKQLQAEKLIAEASERLTKAAVSQNSGEILAAQALLQSGCAKLNELRKEEADMRSERPGPSKRMKT